MEFPPHKAPFSPGVGKGYSSAEPFALARPGIWRTMAPRPRSPEGRMLRGLSRRAGEVVAAHGLIASGDRVLVGLSGGKDSFTLLEVLLHLQARAPVTFDLGALVVDSGFPGFDAQAVSSFAEVRGVATWVVRSGIHETMQDLAWGAAPCALCARLRRGVIYRVAPELGFFSVALGHHGDDAVETVLMNMFFCGQIRGLAPRWRPADPGAPVVIRPLVTCLESDVLAYSRARRFRLVDPACPLCAVPETERLAVKHLVIELSATYPRLRQSLLASMGNVSPEGLMDRELMGLTRGRGSAE